MVTLISLYKGDNYIYMRILNKDTIKEYMLNDIEMLLVCTNDEVLTYCKAEGWDIYDFIQYVKDGDE